MDLTQIIFISAIAFLLFLSERKKIKKQTKKTIVCPTSQQNNAPTANKQNIHTETAKVDEDIHSIQRNTKTNSIIDTSSLSREHKESINKKTTVQNDNKKEDINLSNVEEIRKAIIFSEIINRKY